VAVGPTYAAKTDCAKQRVQDASGSSRPLPSWLANGHQHALKHDRSCQRAFGRAPRSSDLLSRLRSGPGRCDQCHPTRRPGSEPGACFAGSHSPRPPPFAPPAPRPVSRPVFQALFVGFSATMAESDFPGPCIIGYGSSRAAAAQDRCRWCDRPRGPRCRHGASSAGSSRASRVRRSDASARRSMPPTCRAAAPGVMPVVRSAARPSTAGTVASGAVVAKDSADFKTQF
jgi:hypothetical protein